MRVYAASNDLQVTQAALERAAGLCMALGTDGLRGELTLVRAARALADVALVVQASDSARIQEAHLQVLHYICEVVEQAVAQEAV